MLILNYTPNDEYYADWQWNLEQDSASGYPDADIHMKEAWEYAQGSPNVVVAIIDAAFDLDHEDLDPSLYIYPFDAAGRKVENDSVDYDPRLPDNGNQYYRVYWHGTSCLGIFSATTNNETGIASMAGQFKKCPIKMLDDNLATSVSAIEQAFWWPLDANVDIVSLSIGFTLPIPSVTKAIIAGYNYGIAWIAAAGNDSGPIQYPSNLDYVVAVGATNWMDYVASFSNHGPQLDIVAPGVDITTLDVTGDVGYQSTTTGCQEDLDYTCDFGGTSAAAPHVAGVAALVLSRRPDVVCDTCTPELLYEVLEQSANDGISEDDPAGWDEYYGWGRLNADRALIAVVRGDANNDGTITMSDVVYLINYEFSGGPAPVPKLGTGDADGSGNVTIGDAVYVINYLLGGGPAPPINFHYAY